MTHSQKRMSSMRSKALGLNTKLATAIFLLSVLRMMINSRRRKSTATIGSLIATQDAADSTSPKPSQNYATSLAPWAIRKHRELLSRVVENKK